MTIWVLERCAAQMLKIAKVTPDDFRQALDGRTRQPDFTRMFVGLWWDAKGDCQRAH